MELLEEDETDLDDISENKGLINKTLNDDNKANRCQCIYALWLMCLGVMFTIFVGAMVWFIYDEYYQPRLQGNVEPPEHDNIGDFAIDISLLPNRTKEILILEHDMSSTHITEEEREILGAIYALFDADNDNLWNKVEFETFIAAAVEPERKFKEMDFDNNDVLSFKEIVLYLSSFYELDLYRCSIQTQTIKNIFDYEYDENNANDNEADMLYFEYIAHLWFKQLDPNELYFITKDYYIQYIEDEEWEYHNKNDNGYIEESEFIDSFFNSLYYTSFREWLDIRANEGNTALINDVYTLLESINIERISEYRVLTKIHGFDDVISNYANERPSESIFYTLAHLYKAHNVMSMRRRLSDEHVGSGTSCPWNCYGGQGTCRSGSINGKAYDLVRQSFPDNSVPCACDEPGPASCTTCGEVYYSCAHDGGSCSRGECDYGAIIEDRSGSSGAACFSDEGIVAVLNHYNDIILKQLKDLNVGDYVFDGEEFTKVLYNKKNSIKINMIELELNDIANNMKISLILTKDHLVYDADMQLIRADNVFVGDVLYGDYNMTNIVYDIYKPHATPLTISGKIQVNNITASCYTTSVQFAKRAHELMGPMRFISIYLNEKFAATWYAFIHEDVTKMYLHFGSKYILDHFLEYNWITDWISSLYFASIIAVKLLLKGLFQL